MRDRFGIFGTVTRIRKLYTFGNDVKNTQHTRSNLMLLMHGSRIRGKRSGSGMVAHWSCLLKEISLCDQGGISDR